jgi:hypothetical protein
MFGSDATSSDLKDRVGHISDLIYYYALIAISLSIAVLLFRGVVARLLPKIEQYLPSSIEVKEFLLEQIHSLVIFAGIYVYLIYNDGSTPSSTQWASRTSTSSSSPSGSSSPSPSASSEGLSPPSPTRNSSSLGPPSTSTPP